LAAIVLIALVGLRNSERQAPPPYFVRHAAGFSTAASDNEASGEPPSNEYSTLGPQPAPASGKEAAGEPPGNDVNTPGAQPPPGSGKEAVGESPGNDVNALAAQPPPGAAIGADYSTASGLGDTEWPNSPAEDRAVESNHEASAGMPSRDPVNRTDAIWIQERLHDLGYFSGKRSGVWGIVSRNALRDFKSMNGLPGDDRWDKETEQRLLAGGSIRAADTFIGGWSEDAEECRQGRNHNAPLLINSRAAKTDSGECDFRAIRREAAGRWRVVAACSAAGSSWKAHIELKLRALNLNWSSERGSAIYVRCVNDVAK
jgi:hypothetical protein